MKRRVALLLLLAAASVQAKEKMIPLSDADATALSGKTVAVTFHERPSFVAMTAGKAQFALLGVAAMAIAGNNLVDENHVQDPAVLIRSELAAALANAYGAQMQPVDSKPTDAKKPKDIAATHPEADYVLDVRSAGWMYSYKPTQWGTYWLEYGVQVKLVDAKSARLVSNLACTGNTNAHAAPPTRDELHANGAALLKQVTTALGWSCVQLLARQQFRIPEDKIAAIPAEFADPLTARKAKPATAVAAAPAAAPVAAPVAASNVAAAAPAESVAPALPATPAAQETASEPAAGGAAPAATEAAPAAP